LGKAIALALAFSEIPVYLLAAPSPPPHPGASRLPLTAFALPAGHAAPKEGVALPFAPGVLAGVALVEVALRLGCLLFLGWFWCSVQ